MEALSAAQDDSSGANPSSVKSDDSSPQRGSGAGSPPPNCAICLGTCKNKSFTDSCLHQFCFTCLLTWSKVKAECPLCKQAFRSIIHNVRSNHQYEEYLVVQRHTEEASSRIEIDRVTNATHRFRYRTTLTLPRRETIAIQELLRHYPFMADVFPPPVTRAPPARRRRSPASFRRTVYRHNLWARPLPDFTGRYRDCTPDFYRNNSTQMHRLAPWLNRELNYLLNENVGHISYVLARILELLPQHHISSLEFREAMQRYFGERTEHFLHELYCFASTPYDMAGYDRNVQYTTDSRISTMINEVISSSDTEASVDSDIVMVSSSEPADPPPGPSRVAVPAYPLTYITPPAANTVIPIETISQSDSDDDSSEVMVVGYIKPPQDRTPEIVDLLGSDSDVIVQEPSPAPEPERPPVKLTLKRHRPRSPRSASDSSFTPPRRRAASSSSSSSSSSDDDSGPRPARAKPRRKPAAAGRDRRKADKRPSRSHHRDRRDAPAPEPEKRSSRKSHSGKGVKSSNKTREEERSATPSESTPSALDQPGPSGTSSERRRKSSADRTRRRRDGRESRRLRSVVNVMYHNSHRNTDDSNTAASNLSNGAASSAKCVESPPSGCERSSEPTASPRHEPRPEPRDEARAARVSPATRKQEYSSTDSEDNLPLNLTLQRISSPSVSST
ncbi:topoisomerase I-interacting protein isoform X1 [Anticarsia gemmatalis]|uniref:topoisomerase I-interacting protein isoform X1 n=1 Tax=Anticarsia gemmatalis TaxID=129554 RepID=UPI003F772DF8